MNAKSLTTTTETWKPIGTTLVGGFRLESILDTVEGFRIIIGTRADEKYVIRTDVVYYQVHKAAYQAVLSDSAPAPALADTSHALFEVLNSTILRRFTATPHSDKYARGDLHHFALCLDGIMRIDLIARGKLTIRMAGKEDFSGV